MPGRKRILVLDLDEEVLIRLEQMLEEAGFETTTTWRMQDAMSLLQAEHFDLLLVGDHPPEVNADEFLNAARALPEAPWCVVLLPSATINKAGCVQLAAAAVLPRDSLNGVVSAVREQLGIADAAA